MPPEFSVLMPCLNEAESLGFCVEKAKRSLRELGIEGEVIVADNGSSDGSVDIARELGARVVHVPQKGYGNALRGGVAAALGEFVIMGDADDSYDFSVLGPFVEKLREGFELVMGNRFRGKIMPGAMPWKHRYLGNPVLSAIGKLFFKSPVGDFHCGLRGFRKEAYEKLDLQCTGMEFASEMVIKSTLKSLRITEVPITLYKDRRSRPPHLRSWRDGWRHLRFMLLFSPLWLFLIPGATCMLSGLALGGWLLPGPRFVSGIRLDVHTLLVSSFILLTGYQLVIFGAFTKGYAIAHGLHPPHAVLNRFSKYITLERGVLSGMFLFLGGLAFLVFAVYGWRERAYGLLDTGITMRQVIPAITLMAFGGQTVFASFFLSILALARK